MHILHAIFAVVDVRLYIIRVKLASSSPSEISVTHVHCGRFEPSDK